MPTIENPNATGAGVRSEAEKDALEPGECRGCGAPIYWVKLESGKCMPLDRGRQVRVGFISGRGFVAHGSYTSHFATCPAAKDFRKKKEG
jgi:hypothetical protein